MGIETAIVGFLTTLTGSAAAAAAIYTIGQFVVLYAATSYAANRAAQGTPDLSARTITSRGTVDPAKIIYGEALTAGTLAFRNALGLKNREMWAVHVLAGHECESITDVYLDDKVIANSAINSGNAAGGAVTSGDYGPVRSQTVCAIYKHLGTSTQTANSALVTASADWTSNHRLRGHAYAVTEFVLWDKTQDLWEAGDPTNVKFLVKGKKIYDPRLDSTQVIDSSTSPITLGSGSHRVDDSTTWEWSDCPPLCLADYLMDSKFSPLAGGIDPARIDWESVAKAADDCDTLVFIPPAASPQNTEKRYTCNGVIYGTDTPENNVKNLLSSFNGALSFTGGKYSIYAGVYESPADTLSEDDVIGAIGVNSALDSDKRINTLKAIYTDPDKSYEATETAAIELYKDERDNGDELIDTLELPMTNSWYMAQRICLLRLQEANQELTITVPCNLKAARLVPGQRINFTLTERGWTPKVFKVLSWEFFDRGGNQLGVNLKLKEDDSAAYGDPDIADYNTVNSAGVLTIADPSPTPGLDSVPRGIRYGEGAWNITLIKDSANGTPDQNDGEVWFTTGKFALSDGTVREITTAGYVTTPYENTAAPPDQVAYIIWGATNPDTRFGSATYGTLEADGLFCAIYDRNAEQWYAVNDSNTETTFTPADTDYVVAKVIKTSASGGLDSLQTLVPYVNDPEATVGATLGTDVFNEAGAVLSDIDVRNDQLVTKALNGLNQNPGFEIPRVNPLGAPGPAGWWGYGSANAAAYVDPDARDLLLFAGGTGLNVASSMIPIEPGADYEIICLARKTDAGDATTLNIFARYLTSDPAAGEIAVGPSSFSGAGSDPSSIFAAQDGNTSGTAHSLTTSFAIYTKSITFGATVKWASIILDVANNSGAAGNVEVEWCVLRSLATTNTGALADQDTADFATDVDGSEKPENNATVGASVPDGNFIGEYSADANSDVRIAHIDAATGTSSTSWTTLRTLTVVGSGTLKIEFDTNSASIIASADVGADLRIRQNGVNLWSASGYLSNGNWVANNVSEVVTLQSDPSNPVLIQAQNPDAVSIQIRNVDVFISTVLGETIT